MATSPHYNFLPLTDYTDYTDRVLGSILILNPINVLYKGKDLSLGYRTGYAHRRYAGFRTKIVDLLTDLHKNN